ncbi:MAG TPA: rhodanese-like domain-containing protein [Verrucomicrobiota bacterium]|nr:rhodanese-like domain-containing protein [Verrucomicrobiota bacterium]HNU50571.1 rhodanese-like domain-containing protein [Verrucomicrobiota bacterium]
MKMLILSQVLVCVVSVHLELPVMAAGGTKIRDSESASHGAEDAFHQIADTYRFPGFEIVQFTLPVLSHYSYLLVSGPEAVLVDPDRDINGYLEYATKHGLTIKGVFLTHSHADFVAGHLETVRALNVPIYQNAASGAQYKIEPLEEGSTFRVGKATVKAISTPGHTPDGMCGLVSSEGEAQPRAVFTGDTLFVGSIGRPDLLEGTMTAATLASMSYDTWHNKLSKLPESIVVLPAHGAGSLCGANLSDDPSSTIGREKSSNPYGQKKGRSEFIAAVLEGLPDAPQYFKHNAAMNRAGPPLVDWNATATTAKAEEAITKVTGQWLVDLREAKPYAAGHVPGSVNIALRGRLETWVGTMVPWKAPLVLIGSEAELKEAVFRLHRVAYEGSVLPYEAWTQAGLALATSGTITPAELYQQMQAGSAPILVDVRMPHEWMALRIGTVVNLPINRLAELSGKLDPNLPVVAVCNSAYRSSLAAGILQRQGFRSVASLDGGSAAWIDAGYPVYGNEKQTATSAPQRQVQIAERISPADLGRLIQDLPGTFDLVDIRPPEAFQDFALPGARHADLADVLENPGYLTGAGPLIIVDRDGSLAMMAAGILSQKTKRPIKALHGGLEAFWEETEMRRAVRAVPLPGGGARPQAMPGPGSAPRPATPPPTPSTRTPTTRKSAGC